ncbi:hypothetical protein Tco_0699675 [Tanacetum coccineum]
MWILLKVKKDNLKRDSLGIMVGNKWCWGRETSRWYSSATVWIQCLTARIGHLLKECRKAKTADSDEEIDEQDVGSTLQLHGKIQEVYIADSDPDALSHLVLVHYDTDHNVFANDLQHFEQSESISNTCAVETGDSNVIPDSPDMCDNDIQNDQHDVDCDDERVALANLIANLKLDVDDNKKIQKQLKKANAT